MTVTPIDALPHVLVALAPHLAPDQVRDWVLALAPPMRASGITTERRIAMFLGQCCEETGCMTDLVEDLNYSAARLCQVWPDLFPTSAEAAPFARNPFALGCKVYADKLGNGPETSGDGFIFRGRGLIQITGRAAYEAFFQSVHRTLDPGWLESTAGAAQSACWYWSARGRLNDLSDEWDVRGVTQRINGGLVNLPARVAVCNKALAEIVSHRPATPSAQWLATATSPPDASADAPNSPPPASAGT
jgi:putative chitinase